MKTNLKNLFLVFFLFLLFPFVFAGELRVTQEHPFLIDGEWISASELKIGDELTLDNGSKIKITKLTDYETEEPFKVYNLEAGEYHNFVVGEEGVVVHNSDLRADVAIHNSDPRAGSVLIPSKKDWKDLISRIFRRGVQKDVNIEINNEHSPIYSKTKFKKYQKVTFHNKESGKEMEGYISKIYSDGSVKIKYNANKVNDFSVGETVIVPRTALGEDKIFSYGEILSIDSYSGLARVKVPKINGNNFMLEKDSITKDITYATKYAYMSDMFHTDNTANKVYVSSQELDLIRTATVAESIKRAIRAGEIRPISSYEYNPFVKDSYRIENANPRLMTSIQEGGIGRVPIAEGETATWVLTTEGILRVANKGSVKSEMGIKHIQLALGEEIVYAGEMKRVGGKLRTDLASGTFSRYGLNSQFKINEMNNYANVNSFLGEILHYEKISVIDIYMNHN